MSGGAVQGDSRRSRGSRRVKDPPAPAGVVIAELPPPPENQRQGKKDHAEAEGHVVLPPPPESQRQGKKDYAAVGKVELPTGILQVSAWLTASQ